MSEQTSLLDLPGQGIVIPDDPLGVSTGERLRVQRPEVYAQIIAGLAEGMSVSSLHRATGVHRDTIRAVRYGAEHGEAIGQAKERTRHKLARFVEAAAERLLEDVDHMPTRDLPIAMGVAFDKLQLLDGAPTSIVERRDGPTHDDLNAYLATLTCIQPVSGMESLGQKGSARPALESGAVEAASVVSGATSQEEA